VLDRLLDGARLWGLELDIRFRVLAATVDPAADRHPEPGAGDLRLQLVLHPVGRVVASLVRRRDGGATIERFTEDQLALVVDRLDGPRLAGPVIDGPAPDPGSWAPEASMEGASTVGDGDDHHAVFDVTAGDRRLRLAAWFDVAELRRPDGSELPLPPG
jgi:hypothetical protein